MAGQTLIQEVEGAYRNGKTVLVRGVRMPNIYAYGTGFEDFIDKFEVRQDDIFIVGFPRSGTTWLQEITWQILNNGKTSTQPIGHRVPFFDEAKCANTTQPDLIALPSPRVMKTHQPFHAIPKANKDDCSGCKYIYVARNPKDVVVSYFNFDSKMAPITGYSGPFEFFAKMFLEGKVFWGSWVEHVLGWWENRNEANVLYLKYEDLKEDLVSQVSLIADFLGISLTCGIKKRIAKQCTFDEMANNPGAYWMLTQDNALPNFLRKGLIGGWKEYFTPELNARFESEVLSKLNGTGLQFVFDC